MKTDAYANTAIILVSGLVCLSLTIGSIWRVAANRTTNVNQRSQMPEFRGQRFGQVFVPNENTKPSKPDGREQAFYETVDESELKCSVMYVTVDGKLSSAVLTIFKGFEYLPMKAIEKKLGKPDAVGDKPFDKTWHFSDGTITTYDRTISYYSNYFDTYFEEKKNLADERLQKAL